MTEAIKYVQGKMDHLNNQEKKLLQDTKQKEGKDKPEPEDIDPQKTNNGVF